MNENNNFNQGIMTYTVSIFFWISIFSFSITLLIISKIFNDSYHILGNKKWINLILQRRNLKNIWHEPHRCFGGRRTFEWRELTTKFSFSERHIQCCLKIFFPQETSRNSSSLQYSYLLMIFCAFLKLSNKFVWIVRMTWLFTYIFRVERNKFNSFSTLFFLQIHHTKLLQCPNCRDFEWISLANELVLSFSTLM